MARVQFDHVYKRFGNTEVVRDINLDIHDQEFLVMVGPSGCGKSTCLRMIAGLETVSEGTLRIGDRVVNDVPPKDRDIAMVFQNYALYPHMNVYDNLAFGLQLHHVPKVEIKKRVQEAAEILGIDHLLKRKPKELSGGQRQRVALGRALVREPQVFLMDEPLSNLDAKLRVQTRAEIAKLHQRVRTTTIYVTHDQVEAMTMGERICVLNGGIIQQLGTPKELYDHPANLFVAGFIGSPAMNFFENARVTRGDDGPWIDLGFTRLRIPEQHREAAGNYLDQQVTFGIRPEHLESAQLAPDRATADNTFEAPVEVVEHLGNEMLVYLGINGKQIVARVDPRTDARPGQMLTLCAEMSQMHLFSTTDGRALI